MRKVVISGIGLITPLGKNWNDFVQKILIGQGAIKNTTLLLEGKKDLLRGLKENILMGRLIPAGTGVPRYKDYKAQAIVEEDQVSLTF